MPTTRDLLNAQKRGAKILTVFDGEVRYVPRRKGDRRPWVWVGKPTNIDDFRCSSGELHAVEQETAPAPVEGS
jgi:hypothetical protein